jgi:hypothetical protein
LGISLIPADEHESAVRPMWTRPPGAIVMAMNPLVIYLVFVGVAVAVALSAMVMARPMARCCPGCDADVRLDARACGRCGYTFT